MSETQQFQLQVEDRMRKYFIKKIQKIELEESLSNSQELTILKNEYKRQYNTIQRVYQQKQKSFSLDFKMEEVLVSSISEPKTYYTLDDFTNNGENSSIYSPRIDIAFSPIIKKKRGKSESIGVYKLTNDVRLFKLLHKCEFIKQIEKRFREVSNTNMLSEGLKSSDIGLLRHDEYDYVNKRPLHLFGIEIENQKNSKHLMGDFLNAISLSRIPVVVVPEERYRATINMLKFSSTIGDLKEVPIYEMLRNVNVLTINQFRNILNEFLVQENIEKIGVINYY